MDYRALTEPTEALAIYRTRFTEVFGMAWDDLILAYDFGYLPPAGAEDWLHPQWIDQPSCRRLLEQGGQGKARFEPLLWDACREATGWVPRPGHERWGQAQDRWRIILLREALVRARHLKELTFLVQDIYETMGSPEDMVGILSLKASAEVERAAVEAFVQGLENRLSRICPSRSNAIPVSFPAE